MERAISAHAFWHATLIGLITRFGPMPVVIETPLARQSGSPVVRKSGAIVIQRSRTLALQLYLTHKLKVKMTLQAYAEARNVFNFGYIMPSECDMLITGLEARMILHVMEIKDGAWTRKAKSFKQHDYDYKIAHDAGIRRW